MAKWTLALLSERALQRMGIYVAGDLAAMEVEGLLDLMKRQVRVRIADAAARDRGKPAFDRKPNFGFPAMPSGSRLTSRSGERTIHFAINKGAERSASSFDAYATEKGKERAPEQRLEAAEGLNGPSGVSTASAAALDRYAGSHGGEYGTVASVRTNLASDTIERGMQWDRLEEFERRQGLSNVDERRKGIDRINLRVDLAPDFARVVAADPDCPERLCAIITEALGRVENGHRYEGRRVAGEPFVDADASLLHTWIRNLPAWQALPLSARQSFKLSPGRAVQTHVAFELELPKEFDDLACETVDAKLLDHLANLGRTGRDDPRLRVPVAIARHRPDRLNDPRNGHLHGLCGTRRVMIGADGRLLDDEGSNVLFDSRKVPAITSRAFPKQMRRKVAGWINIELERLDAAFRVSPESYATLGIGADPQRKLGGEATVLSRAGVPVIDEQENVLEAWRRKFAEITVEHHRELACKQDEARLRELRIEEQHLSDSDWDRVQIWSVLALQKEEEAARLHYEERQVRLLMDMAVSRPELVTRFAPAYAEKAAERSRYDHDGWLARAADAFAYRRWLDEELEVEERVCEERRLDALALEREAKHLVADIDGELARASEPEPVGVHLPSAPESRAPVSVPTLSSEDISALIEAIRIKPLPLVMDNGLLRVDEHHDPDRRYAAALFDSPSMQSRLAAIQKTRDIMPKPLAAWNAAHPGENAEQAAPRYIAELARVWRLTRTHSDDTVDANRSNPRDEGSEPFGSGSLPSADRTVATNGTPTSISRGFAPSDVKLAEQKRRKSERRARAIFDQELRQLIRPNGVLGKVALGFLAELGARPEHYRRDRGQLVCAYPDGGRATAFELLMRDDEVRRFATQLHAHVSGDPHAEVPGWLIKYVDRQQRNVTAAWTRQASAPADRLKKRLPEVLATRPLLTRTEEGIGYADEGLAQAAGRDILGITSRNIQFALEAACRLQEAERDECLAMVASGRVKVKSEIYSRPKFGVTLRAAVSDEALPNMFARFIHDAAFASACAIAAQTGRPEVKRFHPYVRAWSQAKIDAQPDAVLKAIADALWRESDLKKILVEAGRDVASEMGRIIGRSHELQSFFPKVNHGYRRKGVASERKGMN